ncbi:MAG: hypothetical protein CML06_21600 [Pseudomonadales bacterium]|nr:hypothetical protein [Pseudomonadales bacterium]
MDLANLHVTHPVKSMIFQYQSTFNDLCKIKERALVRPLYQNGFQPTVIFTSLDSIAAIEFTIAINNH